MRVTKAVKGQMLKVLEQTYGHIGTALHYTSPFELLVAVILSAQCTDVRVNLIAPALFRRFPDAFPTSRRVSINLPV